MCYWGNTYMPMIDEMVHGFAEKWVERIGNDIDHDWPPYMGSDCDDETVLAFIERIVDEYRDEFKYPNEPPCGHYGYAEHLLEGLGHAITIVLEGDM